MSKLDISIPNITLGEAPIQAGKPRALIYTAEKGINSASSITSLKINGEPVNIVTGQTIVTGTWNVLFAGDYTLYVEDGAGNSNTKSCTVRNVAIDAGRAGVFTVTDSWDQQNTNGVISIDGSKITGGKYDALALSNGAGYKGSYEYALVKAGDAYNGPAGTAAEAAYFTSPALNWQAQTTFAKLPSGLYTVYIRDAQDPSNIPVIEACGVTVGNDAVTFSAGTKLSSGLGAKDGSIIVTAGGGRSESGRYRFAILSLAGESDALAGLSAISNWVDADDEDALVQKCTFGGLSSGWYQISVMDKGLDYNLAENYNNAISKKVYVGYYVPEPEPVPPPKDTIRMTDLIFSDTSVEVPLKKRKTKLSADAEKKLISVNKDKAVILSGNGLRIVIPPGTLEPGCSIMDMVVSTDGITGSPGQVVRYTDKNGKKHILFFSVIETGMVYYIASETGSYELADNVRPFGDTNGHWAEDYISFVTARELFLGTGGSSFSPNGPMNRAMFATVLGRLAGIDPSEYPGSSFSDAQQGTWYSAYVQWASGAGIVNGYGNNRFGPDDAVTREQMCVMLARFMVHTGIILPEINKNKVFTDRADISGWALEAVGLCHRLGLVEGTGAGRFNPKGLATRAEVATIFKRFIECVVKRPFQ